jgi:V/A-type H+-transporting ATPase subunit I
LSRLRYAIFSDPDIAYRTYIITSRDYADVVLSKVVQLGSFEPITSEDRGTAKEVEEYIKFIESCKKLFDLLNSYIKEVVTVEVKEIPSNTKQELLKLYEKLSNVLEILRNLDNEKDKYVKKLKELEILKKYLLYLRGIYVKADTSILDYDGEFLYVKTFLGSKNDIEMLKKKSEKVIGELSVDEQNVITTLVFDKRIFNEVLKDVEMKGIKVFEIAKVYSIDSLNNTIDRIGFEEEFIKSEIAGIEMKIRDILKSNIYDIALMKTLIDMEYSKTELLKTALESKRLSLLTGWILKSRKEDLLKELKDTPSYVIFEESPEPPVDFNNLKPFKPFEMYTELVGYPSPREWDPTPFLTYFYALFFALMFPDIGYAIGLLIGSKYVLPYFVQNPETLQKLRKIVYTTSACAIVTGLLSASFLGSLIGQYIAKIVPPILPSPPPGLSDLQATMSFMMSAIKLALLVGYLSILTAHIATLIRASIKMHDIWTSLLELCLILMIILGPPFITYRFSSIGMNIDVFKLGKIIPANIIEYIIYSSLILYIMFKIKVSGGMGALFWIFDIIGVLADNMSFVRIAGIGAGTAMLTEVFNGFIYSIVKSLEVYNIAIGIIAGIITSALLHIFVLASSVLGPYIHSLRLITYEMASKFYEGSGRKIIPIKVSLGSIALGLRGTT